MSNLIAGKLPKVEIVGLKRKTYKLHVNSSENKTGESDTAGDEVVTQSVQGESESESDITKRQTLLQKNPQKWSHFVSTISGCILTETGNKRSQQSKFHYYLNWYSDFMNLIKACATLIWERMEIKKLVKPQQEPFWKKNTLRVIL